MKPEDKDKLNECISILESTDLGLSLVWLWAWDTMKSICNDDNYRVTVNEDEMWGHLCRAVEDGKGFSLEYGAEQIYDDIRDWMLESKYIIDIEDEEDEDEDDEEKEVDPDTQKAYDELCDLLDETNGWLPNE